VPAIPLNGAFGFESHDRGRVRAVTVGVDESRRRMVCSDERFGQEALCCGRVLLGREQEVDCRTGRIHRTIQVAPLALDADVGQSPLGQLSVLGLSLERKRRSISGA